MNCIIHVQLWMSCITWSSSFLDPIGLQLFFTIYCLCLSHFCTSCLLGLQLLHQDVTWAVRQGYSEPKDGEELSTVTWVLKHCVQVEVQTHACIFRYINKQTEFSLFLLSSVFHTRPQQNMPKLWKRRVTWNGPWPDRFKLPRILCSFCFSSHLPLFLLLFSLLPSIPTCSEVNGCWKDNGMSAGLAWTLHLLRLWHHIGKLKEGRGSEGRLEDREEKQRDRGTEEE